MIAVLMLAAVACQTDLYADAAVACLTVSLCYLIAKELIYIATYD